MGTHEVPNQPPPLPELDLFTTDPVLPMAVERHDAGWAIDQLQAFGQRVGSAEVAEWAVLFRESPLNAICEGSGNVIPLDLLRTLAKEPGASDAIRSVVEPALGADAALDAAAAELDVMLAHPDEGSARRLIEQTALVMQGSLAVQHGSAHLADAFCTSRLGGDWGRMFGTLPISSPADALVADALPG